MRRPNASWIEVTGCDRVLNAPAPLRQGLTYASALAGPGLLTTIEIAAVAWEGRVERGPARVWQTHARAARPVPAEAASALAMATTAPELQAALRMP